VTEQNQPQTVVRCDAIEQLAILHACAELDPATHAALESHIAQCPNCAAVLSREARLHQAIAVLEQPADSLDPSNLLLAQCRTEFAEALDDKYARAAQPGWRVALSPVAWWGALRSTLVYHPVLSMSVLVVLGFWAGVVNQKPLVPTPLPPHAPALTALVAPKLTQQQLESAGSANVAWVTPSGSRTPTVQVQLMSQTPTSIVGPPEDTDVQRALSFLLSNGQRFDAGVRMDTLDVLRTRCADPDVRRLICSAVRTDGNPAVRIKAIDSLQGFEQDPTVRQTLIEALENDGSSGVRVEAMNLLVNALRQDGDSGPADPRILAVLRDRLRNDPNNYIRLQSAAILRQLRSNELP
jgi:hypothetical protein